MESEIRLGRELPEHQFPLRIHFSSADKSVECRSSQWRHINQADKRQKRRRKGKNCEALRNVKKVSFGRLESIGQCEEFDWGLVVIGSRWVVQGFDLGYHRAVLSMDRSEL